MINLGNEMLGANCDVITYKEWLTCRFIDIVYNSIDERAGRKVVAV